MPEIKKHSLDPTEDISESLIHIPDDSDMGTGTYSFTLKPHVLRPDSVIVSAMFKPPEFQVTATLNGAATVSVVLGRTDNDRSPAAIFILPAYVKRNVAHTVEVKFAAWKVFSTTFSGVPLRERNATAH